MRDETEPIYINASAEVKKLQVEKAALIKRLTEIHAEIDAYGYLHTNNHPPRTGMECDHGNPPVTCSTCGPLPGLGERSSLGRMIDRIDNERPTPLTMEQNQ